jgi:hypothetical protein
MDDTTSWTLWNSIPAGSDWHWDDVHNSNNESQVMRYELDTGYHTLSVCFREDGAFLDKFFLANTGTVPEGIGETDDSCPDLNFIENTDRKLPAVSVFPNPARSEIKIVSDTPFSTLAIFSIEGKKLSEEHYGAPVYNKYLSLSFEPGIYFIRVSGNASHRMIKLIIK